MKRGIGIGLLFLLTGTVTISVLAQSPVPAKLPEFIPPSPDASSLGKFGDIPVGTYTGLPNISIPLYTVTSRDLSLPINLSYHPSGIRVEEEASWVGLGWALNAGGMVSRTVRGRDDLIKNVRPGYLYSQPVPNEVPVPGSDPPVTMLPLGYVVDVCSELSDAQPDVFNFNFLGYFGKFYLKKKSNINAPVEVVLASNNEKIAISYDEIGGRWIILTKEGIKAEFATKEYSNTVGGTVDNVFNLPNPLTWEVKEDVITSWYLDKLTSPRGEVITFEYDLPSNQPKPIYCSRSLMSISETATRVAAATEEWEHCGLINFMERQACLNVSPLSGGQSPCTSSWVYSGSMTMTWNIYLKKVSFANGELRFLTDTRLDIGNHFTSNEAFAGPRRLAAIEVYESGMYLKTIAFTQTYFGSINTSSDYMNKRLKLDKVSEYKNSMLLRDVCKLAYIGDNEVAATFLPSKNTAARDHWGLYNGKLGNNTVHGPNPCFAPIVSVNSGNTNYTFAGADREAYELAALSGMLERISYPTGGHTKFEYEVHKVTGVSTELVPDRHPYFVLANDLSGQSQVFELKEPTAISIVSDIKCPTLVCYDPNIGTPCTFNSSMVNTPYIKITNLLTGVDVYTQLYDDYTCKGYAPACSSNIVATPCGVTRSEQRSIPAGRYMLKTIPMFGFKAEANLSYNMNMNADPVTGVREYQGGGLRVKKITDHDGLDPSNDMVRIFDYTTKDQDNRSVSTGRLMTLPKYHFLESWILTAGGTQATCSTLKTTSYSNVPLANSAQGSPIGYDHVTIRYGENGENGYSVFQYKNDPDVETEPVLPGSPTTDHSASNGLLLKESHYNRDRFKLKETEHTYVPVSYPSMTCVTTYSTNGCGYGSSGYTAYKKYDVTSEWWQRTSTIDRVYDTQDPTNVRALETATTTFYHTDLKLPNEQTMTYGDGTTEVTFTKYPIDLPNAGNHEMWDPTNVNFKHMHAYVVQQEVRRDNAIGKLISGVRNNYTYQSDKDKVVIVNVENAKTSGSYEARLYFTKYDNKGNVLQVNMSDDIPVSFLWGYSQVFPVAKAVNANWDQIYYEGFETDATAIVDPLIAHSGKKYRTSFVIPFNAPGGIYELSYWKRTGTTWQHQKVAYTGSVTLSGDGIDDVRIYPVGAQMTTYDYSPLTGMITATDANNQSQHFEYDDLQRLIGIKDQNNNLLSGFKYQYKN